MEQRKKESSPKSSDEFLPTFYRIPDRLFGKDDTWMKLIKSIELPPNTKPRMTRKDQWKKRPCVTQYWEYKDKLRELFEARELPIPYLLIFVIPMPTSWSKRKRDSLRGTRCESTPDKDNLEKGFLDALFTKESGIKNDAHVYDGRTLKVWGETGRIVVYAIDPIPEEVVALHTNS